MKSSLFSYVLYLGSLRQVMQFIFHKEHLTIITLTAKVIG